jgi:hypothetical protein
VVVDATVRIKTRQAALVGRGYRLVERGKVVGRSASTDPGGLGGLFRIRDPRTTNQPTTVLSLPDEAAPRPELGHFTAQPSVFEAQQFASIATVTIDGGFPASLGSVRNISELNFAGSLIRPRWGEGSFVGRLPEDASKDVLFGPRNSTEPNLRATRWVALLRCSRDRTPAMAASRRPGVARSVGLRPKSNRKSVIWVDRGGRTTGR